MRTRSVVVVLVAVALFAVIRPRGGESPALAAQAVPPGDARLAALRQERVAIATRALEMLEQQFRNGLAEDAEIARWQRRLFEAETAAAADKAGRVAAAERYAGAARQRTERSQRLFESGQVPLEAMLAVKYDLAGAECALEELKAQ